MTQPTGSPRPQLNPPPSPASLSSPPSPASLPSPGSPAALPSPPSSVHRLGWLWRSRGLMLAVLDGVVVSAAFLLAYWLRFYVKLWAIKEVPVADVVTYFRGAAVLSGLWLFFIWRDGGYLSDLRGVHSLMVRYRSLLHSGFYAMIALMVISFLYRDFLLSRQVYLMTGVGACGGMALVRLTFRLVDRRLARLGLVTQRVVLVGEGPPLQAIAERLEQQRSTIRITGVIDWDGAGREDGAPADPRVRLGQLAELEAIHARSPFDALIVCAPDGAKERGQLQTVSVLALVNFCERVGISAYLSPGSFDVAVTQQEVGSLSGMPLIRVLDASIHPANAIAKRLVDLALGSVALLGTLPFWAVIALAIKLGSRGPVFYRQTRAGLHGRPFTLLKFRSMVEDAEAKLPELVDLGSLAEPVFKIAGDPRVTRLGRFLRRSGLDELPQLLNVLRGEMSLVGPRPEELAMVDRYDPWQRRRLKAKPGITGYQQIMNRGARSLAERVKYDLIYLKYQSLLFDLYILLRTVDVIIRGKGTTD